MPLAGGERPVGEHSTAGRALVHHRTTQTCHSRGAKRRGNLAEPGWIAGYSRRKRDRLREIATSAYGLLAMTSRGASTVLTAAGTDRGCLPEIATSAYGLLAMTNLETSRHRRNAVLVASLQGAHYPQGARRIRKAAKPPTAAQGTPLQTQSVRAILTIAGSNRQCAAGRGAPSQ